MLRELDFAALRFPHLMAGNILQVGAFKDYSPDAAGAASASGGEEKEPAEASQEAEPAEEEEDEGEVEGSSGGGVSYPPHTLGGLPALSPTMSQGTPRK
jgi:hypothetical protein